MRERGGGGEGGGGGGEGGGGEGGGGGGGHLYKNCWCVKVSTLGLDDNKHVQVIQSCSTEIFNLKLRLLQRTGEIIGAL